MSHAVTPENSGAIYVAEVMATLPSLDKVVERYKLLQRYIQLCETTDDEVEIIVEGFRPSSQACEDQFAFPVPEITILATDGDQVHEDGDHILVTGLLEVGKYILLQTVFFEDDESFTQLFGHPLSDDEDADILSFHAPAQEEAAFYLVPNDACGSKDPVRAAAFLCVGTEAVEFFEPPEGLQLASMAIAADVLLDRQT